MNLIICLDTKNGYSPCKVCNPQIKANLFDIKNQMCFT